MASKKNWMLAAVIAVLCMAGTGCEDDGGGGGQNDFVGTWLVTKHDDSPSTSYYVFDADGSFYKTRSGEGPNGAVHLSGTYSANGGTLSGDFTNPGIGSGEIKASINDGGTMEMDFIEHWHTPYKHVPCTGVRQ